MRRFFVTVRLQPQMKKYRCPWYVSTQNHNILYFVHIWRICSLNTALCLWKALRSLVRCGVARFKCRESRAIVACKTKASPLLDRKQGARSVQFAVRGCADVDKWGPVCAEAGCAQSRAKSRQNEAQNPVLDDKKLHLIALSGNYMVRFALFRNLRGCHLRIIRYLEG